MSFAFEAHTNIKQNTRRILHETVDEIMDTISQPDKPDKAIHESRKAIKRIRAVLRLVQGAVPSRVYTEENRFYRDLARLLAPSRDAFVAIKTLDSVSKRYGEHLAPDVLAPIYEHLRTAYDEVVQRDFRGDYTVFEQALPMLSEAHERIKKMPIKNRGFKSLAKGFGGTYTSALDWMGTAYTSQREDDFHEWRKYVKYHWHHVELLTPIYPEALAFQAEQLHQLSEILGNEHDCTAVKAMLAPVEATDKAAFATLTDLLNTEQWHLRESAYVLGHRIFAPRPKHVLHAYRTYWDIWQQQAPAPDLP